MTSIVNKLKSYFCGSDETSEIINFMDNGKFWSNNECLNTKKTTVRIYHIFSKYTPKKYSIGSTNDDIFGFDISELQILFERVQGLNFLDFYRTIWMKLTGDCREEIYTMSLCESLLDYSDLIFLSICLEYNYIISGTRSENLKIYLLGTEKLEIKILNYEPVLLYMVKI